MLLKLLGLIVDKNQLKAYILYLKVKGVCLSVLFSAGRFRNLVRWLVILLYLQYYFIFHIVYICEVIHHTEYHLLHCRKRWYFLCLSDKSNNFVSLTLYNAPECLLIFETASIDCEAKTHQSISPF